MQSADRNYSVPPFPAFPSITRYVPLGSLQETMDRVRRSVDAQDAISLVIGPPGTGKSLLCGLLVDHYRSSHDVVVLGETPIDGREAFQRHLLHHLGADFDRIAERDLQLELIDRVCSNDAAEGGLLIIVDEAQSLSLEVLEAIRMATNIMRDGEPRVLAVLCGGIKLEELLIDQIMEPLTQRVATRCYLHPLNGDETHTYITETIRACGSDPDETVTDEAIAAVHHACSGVPRLINQMLTQAIDCAEEAEQTLITEQTIDQAWAELQQLPSPMVQEPRISHKVAPVEFGELDESISFGQWNPDEKAELQIDPESDACQEMEFSPAETCKTEDICETVNNNAADESGEPAMSCGSGECGDCQSIELELHRDNAVNEIEAQEHGIDIESSTATWIEEPAEETSVPATPSSSSLFGDFDQEEEVAVGSTFARPQTSEPPTNLEEILQQEIVSLSAFGETASLASDVALVCDSQFSEAEESALEPAELVDEAVELIPDDIEIPDCEAEEAEAVLRIPQPEPAASVETEEDITIRDDSDILVIEDEIELRRLEPAARVDAQEKTISVDFQAMLTRMQGER